VFRLAPHCARARRYRTREDEPGRQRPPGARSWHWRK
jgi:hypothetical protein